MKKRVKNLKEMIGRMERIKRKPINVQIIKTVKNLIIKQENPTLKLIIKIAILLLYHNFSLPIIPSKR
jgi:hypothetical protein